MVRPFLEGGSWQKKIVEVQGRPTMGHAADILLQAILMFAASLMAGYVPLVLSISPTKLKYMTTVGTGMLVGTAFIVIIPEGIHATFNVHRGDHSKQVLKNIDNESFDYTDIPLGCIYPVATNYIGLALVAGFVLMLLVEQLQGSEGENKKNTPTLLKLILNLVPFVSDIFFFRVFVGI